MNLQRTATVAAAFLATLSAQAATAKSNHSLDRANAQINACYDKFEAMRKRTARQLSTIERKENVGDLLGVIKRSAENPGRYPIAWTTIAANDLDLISTDPSAVKNACYHDAGKVVAAMKLLQNQEGKISAELQTLGN